MLGNVEPGFFAVTRGQNRNDGRRLARGRGGIMYNGIVSRRHRGEGGRKEPLRNSLVMAFKSTRILYSDCHSSLLSTLRFT